MNNLQIIDEVFKCFNKFFSKINPRLKIELKKVDVDRAINIYLSDEIVNLRLLVITNNEYYLNKTGSIFKKFNGYLQLHLEILGINSDVIKFSFEHDNTHDFHSYQDISIEELIDSGIIFEYSLYGNYIKKYLIRQIRMMENKVVGPGLGMIKLIEDEYKKRQIRSVADLFAGSCGYAKVCTELGITSVDAFDIDFKCEYLGIQYYKVDLLDFKLSNKYDLILVDPPKTLHEQFLSYILDTKLCGVIIFRFGNKNDDSHCTKLLSLLEDKKIGFAKQILYNELYIRMEEENEKI